MRHIPKVGAFVLETLTTGMYTDPFDCIREYIQNASDSIFNAERFSQLEKNNGRIEVSINPQKRTLSIRDNGVGIGPDDLAHIFDKFYRVKNDSTHAIKGSGLGLYLVKYFIELHNGVITATSQLGQGTTFIIKLKNE